MTRRVCASLLLGAALASSLLFCHLSQASQPQAFSDDWIAASRAREFGSITVQDEVLHMNLDKHGAGSLLYPVADRKASSYPLLHMDVIGLHSSSHIYLVWGNSESNTVVHRYKLDVELTGSTWISTRKLKGWTGDIQYLGFLIYDPDSKNGQIIIKDFSAYPTSPIREATAILSDWTGYKQWSLTDANYYAGITGTTTAPPAPVIATLFFIGVLIYRLLLLFTKLRFDWRVVALFFFFCWFCLDMLWQRKLFIQNMETYEIYSNMTSHQKLLAGPDAELYEFISTANDIISQENPRIFVNSRDLYAGMRSAYYLLPRRVYWSRYVNRLPLTDIRSGDYIVLLSPTVWRFDRAKQVMSSPKNKSIRTELVFSKFKHKLLRAK